MRIIIIIIIIIIIHNFTSYKMSVHKMFKWVSRSWGIVRYEG